MASPQGVRLGPSQIQFITSAGFHLTWPTEQFLDDNLSTYYTGDARFYNNVGSSRGYFGSGSFAVDSYTGRVWVHAAPGAGFVALEEGLNGHGADTSKVVNLDRALVPEVNALYQSRITGVKISMKTVGDVTFRLEVKNTADVIIWNSGNSTVNYATTTDHTFTFPAGLSTAKKLFLVFEFPVDVDIYSWRLTLSNPVRPYWESAFATAYSQMTRAHNPSNGYSRDQIVFNAGEYDSVPATGLQILSQAMAYDLGVTPLASAQAIATSAANALYAAPQHSTSKLLPHFLQNGNQHPSSEWSTVDTAIALIAGLIGLRALGLTTQAALLSARLDELVYTALISGNLMSMGYEPNGTTIITARWDTYGGEAVLADAPRLYQNPANPLLAYVKTPPVFAGRGFIQEIAAAIIPRFGRIGAGTNEVAWRNARSGHLTDQKAFANWTYYGKSSGEIILPNRNFAYLAAGIGDGVNPAEDTYLGNGPYFLPHYVSLVADLDRTGYLITQQMANDGLWLPFSGPVESFARNGSSVNLINFRQISLNSFFHVAGLYWKWAAVTNRTLITDAIAADTRLNNMVNALLTY